jgi:hypothetical protein
LDHLTSAQISEWEAYDRIDPIGTWREDYRMAFLSSVISNLAISINAPAGTEKTSPLDFMPNWSGEEIEKEIIVQSPEEILSHFTGLAGLHKKKEGRANVPSKIVEKLKVEKAGIQSKTVD